MYFTGCKWLLFFILSIFSAGISGQIVLSGDNNLKVFINDDGRIDSLTTINNFQKAVLFRQDRNGGPTLIWNNRHLALNKGKEAFSFVGENDSLAYGLTYKSDHGKLMLEVSCTNLTKKRLDKQQFSLQVGINTEMVKYPDWRDIFFPTMMRCEKDHFWGYLMTPAGRIMTLTSPDPVASYRLHYNNRNQKRSFSHGHRIFTVTLDLLHPLPQPARHPQEAHFLRAGETKRWTVCLEEAENLGAVPAVVARNCNAPAIQADYYSVVPGETSMLTIYSSSAPALSVETPEGKKQRLKRPEKTDKNRYQYAFNPKTPGEYTFTIHSEGKTAEAKIYCRKEGYSNYIKAARNAALRYPQHASSHTESWYGFFSAYIAREFFPEEKVDREVDEMFQSVFPLMYDTITNLPVYYNHRIQNHALMAALLAQRYKVTGDIADLRAAADLADYIMAMQTPDGAYRNGNTHYTSVIYVAKALMEVMEVEKKLINTSFEWADNYRKHYHSVKKAIDELAKNLDNIQTEGEMTFEDGMISCSYTQISEFALLQPEGSPEREYYTQRAEQLAYMHRCLSQLVIPDARMHGGSLRFWEAQYDILSFPNMMNSPHGWSAWRIYGLKNLYLLTGKYDYLHQMKNAIETCIRLIDPVSGDLNWAFISDPYIDAELFVPNPEKPGKGKYITRVIGEEYMPMISDWYRPAPNRVVTGYWGYDGGSCDNDVHEIFKCLNETFLTSAYIHELEDGNLKAFNCKAEDKGGVLTITPAESCVSKIHVQLKKNRKVKVMFQNNPVEKELMRGWVR